MFHYLKFVWPLLALFFFSCKTQYYTSDIYRTSGINTQIRHAPPSPIGMVYVPDGQVSYISLHQNSALAVDTTRHRFTVSGFFMDVTETTNKQYRTFVDWVADSIIIKTCLKQDKRFILQVIRRGKNLKHDAERINWSLITGNEPLWNSKAPKIRDSLIAKGFLIKDSNEKYVLNREKLYYVFFRPEYSDQGKYIGEKKDSVKVYPNTAVWRTDFERSQNDTIMKSYFEKNKGFDNCPVIGVTWLQAMAYSHWRGNFLQTQIARKHGVVYSLPSEMQWRLATIADISESEFDKTPYMRVKDWDAKTKTKIKANIPAINFKQRGGEYNEDAHNFPAPVKSYPPNSLGLYELRGNVSEWVLDGFKSSYEYLVHDLNPVLLTGANTNMPESMKRKVIVGGDWHWPAEYLNPLNRNNEVFDVPHSYTGFRCVLPAPELRVRYSK